MSVHIRQSRITFVWCVVMISGGIASAHPSVMPRTAAERLAHAELFDPSSAANEPVTAPVGPGDGVPAIVVPPADLSVTSFSVVPSAPASLGVRSKDSASGAKGESADAAGVKGYEGGVNYKGEKITGATTRYFEDFESGQVGGEWATFGSLHKDDRISTFADPSADQGMILNVATKPERVYEVRLDVYLIPPSASITPGDAADEAVTSTLAVVVDGKEMMMLTPAELLKLAGAKPVAGEPTKRKVRFNITAAHGIAEIHIYNPTAREEGWSAWGIDNIMIDLGQQDPVFGFFSPDDPSAIDLFGVTDQTSDMTGEIPPLPSRRFGSNEPISPSSDGGTTPSRQTRVTDDEPEVPAPGAMTLVLGVGALALRRARRG